MAGSRTASKPTAQQQAEALMAQLRTEIQAYDDERAELLRRFDEERLATYQENKALLARLDGTVPAPAPARGKARTQTRQASNGTRTRKDQALNLVRTQPGITIPQLAEAMSIEPNYLYRVMPKLVTEGQVRKDGHGGFEIANGGDPLTPSPEHVARIAGSSRGTKEATAS